MPTALKRHQVTEVPELRSALEVARAAWPDETSTTRLIYRLASAGAEHLMADPAVSRAERQARVVALTGQFPSQMGPDYLDDLRREWDQ